MNLSKISDFGTVFCVVLGGLVLTLLKSCDLIMFVILLVVSIVVLLFYSFLISKYKSIERAMGKFMRIVLAVYSVLSCGVAISTASAVMTDTGAVQKNFYLFYVVLLCVFALIFAYSSRKGAANTAGTTVLLIVLALTVLICSCAINRDFSSIAVGTVNYKFILPLIAFSVCDVVLVLPYISNKGKGTMLLVGTLPHIYMSLMTLIAVSVLSSQLFNEVNLPILFLWRSSYIPSFLNRFELVALVAFFAACAIKAGLVLKFAADVFGKRKIPIIALFLFVAVTLISLYEFAVYITSVIAIVCGVVFPIICVVKNY